MLDVFNYLLFPFFSSNYKMLFVWTLLHAIDLYNIRTAYVLVFTYCVLSYIMSY